MMAKKINKNKINQFKKDLHLKFGISAHSIPKLKGVFGFVLLLL
jgi:hypothetical protein